MNLRDAIRLYHDLLTDEVAEEADDALRRRLKERGLYFGNRPLCIVLRPYFYTADAWNFVSKRLEGLLSAFQRTYDVCVENADYRSQLHLVDFEEELFQLDTGGPPACTSSRLDTFFVDEQQILNCVEYNAETPAGIGYNDILAEVFDELEPMRRFRQHYQARPSISMKTLQDVILDAYYRWGGRESPQICILDWSDVPTIKEHEITKIHLEKQGISTILADPRAVEYRDGHLWADDFRIDIIYKRVLYSELFEWMGPDNAVAKAVRDRAVFITNSPSCKLLAKKASLAFMSDERNAHLFTTAQHGFIQAHIPWTRVVEERKTAYKGQEVDLVPFVADNRDRFVLKPNDDYGGHGVVLGWECSLDGWEASLQQALGSPFVVQEKVPTVTRKFPSWINGELNISDRFVDADPYVYNGNRIYGCLTRVSPMELLNVTAGGGSVLPTFIIDGV